MDAEGKPPRVAIACQGGGSHAAFGAGILDRLLEDHGTRYRLAALSGTSGGAVNAALAWAGLLQGGPNDARARLRGFWKDLSADFLPDMVWNFWGQVTLNLPYTWEVSPYVWDLGARETMDHYLRQWVRLEDNPRERLNDPALFVGATDLRNGVSVAIRGDGETFGRTAGTEKLHHEPFDYDDIIASLAIPPLYKDVRRRGTAFWDGLFSINPPVHAFTDLSPKPDEIWVVQINPQRIERAPTVMRSITDRRNELSGNLALNKELDMIETINRMLGKGQITDPSYTPIKVRIVGLEEADPHLTLASKFDRSPAFLRSLFELGRGRAPNFYEPASHRPEVMHRLLKQKLPTR